MVDNSIMILNGNTQQVLAAYVQRVEKVEEEIKDLNDSKKELYAEVKAVGFDVQTFKKLIARRRKDPDALREQDMILETYEAALEGIIDNYQGPPETDDLFSEELYQEAKKLVLREKRASVSFIQRALQIGYNKAAGIIDRMEAAGLVTKPDQAGKRQVVKGADPEPKLVEEDVPDPSFLDD